MARTRSGEPMVRIALTQAQSESIARCGQPVEFVDANGRVIGVLSSIQPDSDALPSVTANTIVQLIERAREPVANLLSTSQAIERIRGQVGH